MYPCNIKTKSQLYHGYVTSTTVKGDDKSKKIYTIKPYSFKADFKREQDKMLPIFSNFNVGHEKISSKDLVYLEFEVQNFKQFTTLPA